VVRNAFSFSAAAGLVFWICVRGLAAVAASFDFESLTRFMFVAPIENLLKLVTHLDYRLYAGTIQPCIYS
jgi:hypothetical protein